MDTHVMRLRAEEGAQLEASEECEASEVDPLLKRTVHLYGTRIMQTAQQTRPNQRVRAPLGHGASSLISRARCRTSIAPPYGPSLRLYRASITLSDCPSKGKLAKFIIW